jgi:hypothetical protein
MRHMSAIPLTDLPEDIAGLALAEFLAAADGLPRHHA